MKLLQRMAHWLKGGAPAGSQGRGGTYDAFRLRRNPTNADLIRELKNTAWTCASINAATCASHTPRLYVTTAPEDPAPKCSRRPVDKLAQKSLRSMQGVPSDTLIEEVTRHPALTLLAQVSSALNGFDLLELTTLYQEVIGSAYWLLRFHPILGTPCEIWPLPAQHVQPVRERGSPNLVDRYDYWNGAAKQAFRPEEVIHFRYPDPRDPYGQGLSPLRAAYESCHQSSLYAAFKTATWNNSALPSAVVSPEEFLGEDERDRLEATWHNNFANGGQGKVLFADSPMKVNLLSHSLGDPAALAEQGATKSDIANAFHVPLSYLVSETNLANLEASERQHMTLAIRPRLRRRDQKLNEQFLPHYDPSGRLFFASDDPVALHPDTHRKQQADDLRLGVRTINEVRAERGWPEVAWGHKPWIPLALAQSDHHVLTQVRVIDNDATSDADTTNTET